MDTDNLGAKINELSKDAVTRLARQLNQSEHNHLRVRFIEEETRAAAISMMTAISTSAAFGSILMDYALNTQNHEIIADVREAVLQFKTGDLLRPSAAISLIDDSRLTAEFEKVRVAWQEADKMLASYFTIREVEAIAEEIPFVHENVFSYNEEYAKNVNFRDLAGKIRKAVEETIRVVESEKLVEMVFSKNQGMLSLLDEPEENLLQETLLGNDDSEPQIGLKL